MKKRREKKARKELEKLVTYLMMYYVDCASPNAEIVLRIKNGVITVES